MRAFFMGGLREKENKMKKLTIVVGCLALGVFYACGGDNVGQNNNNNPPGGGGTMMDPVSRTTSIESLF